MYIFYICFIYRNIFYIYNYIYVVTNLYDHNEGKEHNALRKNKRRES